MIKLRSTIVTQKGSSHTWTVLHKCLLHWVETSSPPEVANMIKGTPEPLSLQLHRATQEQLAIGWNFALRGYLSVTWVLCQSLEHPKSSQMGIQQQWLKAVIRAIWDTFLALWDERNSILHSSEPSNLNIRDSLVNSKIVRFYDLKDEFAISDSSLFDIPLKIRLTHTIRAKKLWLAFVARYHPTTTSRKLGQQPKITDFFTRQTRAPITNPDNLEDPPNIRTHGLSPLLSTGCFQPPSG